MSYHPDKLRLPRFFRYICRVLGFNKTVSCIGDSRQNPTVEMSMIFRALFIGMLLQWGSIRRLTKESSRFQLRKFLGTTVSFCANTVSYGLEHIDTDSLEEELTRAPKRLKRNQAARQTIGGLQVVAFDGTEIFRSKEIH